MWSSVENVPGTYKVTNLTGMKCTDLKQISGAFSAKRERAVEYAVLLQTYVIV